ncbi:hypothetical protein [Arcobacter sp. FWKO B]|uniref:hypothetical protein n=1 Tax=Arcobacter sp. FWKO B TaxID=2593672 RepID=UPI0018A361FF|nr:hypothetical protein [Arcobacter sp. FWKO B]QOG11901.1 hypothetical protein FWKOB_03925 [Arcobacter sp. FWKO B]
MKKSILALFIIGLVVIVAQSIYQQLNKKVAKSSRIECHKNVTVFERVYNNEKINAIQEFIKDGTFEISLKAEPSKYMKSQLFNYVDSQAVKEYIQNSFGLTTLDNALKINVLLYENDKEDPGKKSAEAKMYAGYLMFDFYLENEMIYKVQIDFMDMQGNDINKTIDCIKQSILSI